MKEFTQETSVTTTCYCGVEEETEMNPGTNYGTVIPASIKVYRNDDGRVSEAVVLFKLPKDVEGTILIGVDELEALLADAYSLTTMVAK